MIAGRELENDARPDAREPRGLRPADRARIDGYLRERYPRDVTASQVKAYVWTNNAPAAAVAAYLDSLVGSGLATAEDRPRRAGPGTTRHYTATTGGLR